ncbi:MAG: diguanylate cyclase [Aeromicrobium sp.]|uniref:GGDEF domain-containing protein n=1 Tax=Aeromicrobium sp. TaxID=1871063 RepID=UPI0039E2BB1B
MNLDATTAQVASAVVLGATAVYLTVLLAVQHDDPPGRITAVAFLMLSATAVLAATSPGDGTSRSLADSSAAAGYVLGFGLLRSGLRLQQIGRTPHLAVPFAAALATAAASLFNTHIQGLPLPLALAVAFSAAFAAAAFFDAARGPFANAPSSRALQAVMGTTALTITTTAVLTLLHRVTWTETIDVVVAIGTLAIFSVTALCLSSLRAETARHSWWTAHTDAPPMDFELNDPKSFRREALDRIDRASTAGVTVSIVWVEITHFSDLGIAFGPDVQDQAVVHVGRVLRAQTPPFSTLGHLGAGRFAVVTADRTARPAERVANAIGHGLNLRSPHLPVMLSYRIGVSVASTTDLDAMIEAARTASTPSREGT